ncbi:hypothetical protein EU537_10585 [Candidatus Thorarchaeota archaeon]|nr:MAG: hypothetical protein EU537_10585 [Candidatus Thorarchaeota archaeon]
MSTAQEKPSLSTMSSGDMFSLWWSEKWVRGLVLALSPIGFIDALFTYLLFVTHGPEYEYNPIVRFALTSNWWFLWIVVDILSFALFAMIAGSYYLHTRSSILGNHVNWFAALIALRVGAALYNVLLYLGDVYPIFWSFILGLITYWIVKGFLSRERDISIEGFKRYWRAKYDRLHDKLLTRGIKIKMKEEQEQIPEPKKTVPKDRMTTWLKRAGYLSLAILLVVSAPYILTAIGIATGAINWSNQYGSRVFWTNLSGTAFVIAFGVIILLVGLMVYFIMKAFHTTEGAW